MDLADDEKLAAISGVDDDEELEEEVDEEVEEEINEKKETNGEIVRESAGKGAEDSLGTAGDEVKRGDNGSSSSSSGKIFVGGVSWETTEEAFAKHFEKYGEITDSVIMKNKHTQTPRGFGFVTFADPSVIDKVLEDEHNIDGRVVEVKRTVPREGMSSSTGGPRTKKIFVGGIPSSITEDDLKEYFGAYGKVVEHQIMVDHSSGRSRGFGFVTFESEETVEKIIAEGKMHDLGGKQVEIKKAEPKRAGGDAVSSGGRGGYGAAGGGSMHGYGGGPYGYGSGYRSGSGFYYGGRGGGYGGGGYGYGGAAGYGGAGLGPSFAASMYGYAAGNGFAAPGVYGGGYGGYVAGRGYGSRYHPYGR